MILLIQKVNLNVPTVFKSKSLVHKCKNGHYGELFKHTCDKTFTYAKLRKHISEILNNKEMLIKIFKQDKETIAKLPPYAFSYFKQHGTYLLPKDVRNREVVAIMKKQ